MKFFAKFSKFQNNQKITVGVFFVAVLLSTTVLPALVFAACTPADGTALDASAFPNPLCSTSLFCFLKSFVDILLKIGIIVAAIFIIYSGFLFVTAGGDTTALKNARTAFLGAVIGTAVLLGSWLIATVLINTINNLRPASEQINLDTCP